MGNNNFNICPRCGTANSAVAKYCFQCGSQLKTAEQPIVCAKCKTLNAANSTYCKACGTMLSTSNSSKICPRCNSYVASGSTICSKCGYSFSGATTIEPVENPNGSVLKPPKKVRPVPVGATKARVGGLLRMIFALLMLYFVIMPDFMSVPSMKFGVYTLANNGVITLGGVLFSGYDIITSLVAGLSGSGIAFLTMFTLNQWIIYIFFAVTMLVGIIELFDGLARLINGHLLKKRNGFAEFMLVIGLISLAYLMLNQYAPDIAASLGAESAIGKVFASWATISTTWLAPGYYIMVGYYLALIILSGIFRKPKQQLMNIGR